MDKIFDVLGNPFLWGIILFILGFLMKQKLNTYLKLLNLLIEAIEIIDNEIKDIVDDKTRESLLRIKEWIDRKVGKKERKVLDNALKNKGLLNKGEYKP
jgi:hypothetical protein